MENKFYNKDILEAVTQAQVSGKPARSLDPFHLVKTTLFLLGLLLTGCASTNNFSVDSKYSISENESYSQWSERQPNPQKDTYIGSGINPSGGGDNYTWGTQWPFGRTGWGVRPFEPNF